MTKCTVLLVGPHLSLNLGGPSIVLGITRVLGEQLEGPRFLLAGHPPDEAAERLAAERYQIPTVPLPRGRLSLASTLQCAAITALTGRTLVGSRSVRRFLRAVQEADAVVSCIGIMFADSLGKNSFRRRAREGLLFGVAKALGKPVVQYTADFGPLETRWNRFFAKFWLGRCVDAILCRNQTSLHWLTQIGISADKLQVAPDTGFLMEVATSEAAKRFVTQSGGRPMVAVGVSHQVRCRYDDPAEYDSHIGGLIRHAAGKRGLQVLVVPNDMSLRADADDRSVAERIVRQTANPEVAMVDAAGLTGPEMKAILGQCEVIVSSRYHSLVAGLSMGVPCLALGWHHKYRDLLRLFEMDEWVLDYSSCSEAQLIDAFERIWRNRVALRDKISSQLPAVEAAVRDAAAVVARHLARLAPGRIRLRKGNAQDESRYPASVSPPVP